MLLAHLSQPQDMIYGNNVRFAPHIPHLKSHPRPPYIYILLHMTHINIDLWWGHFGHIAPDLTQFSVVILPQIHYIVVKR